MCVQDEVVQVGKFMVFGIMLVSISYEFNQLLVVICSYVDNVWVLFDYQCIEDVCGNFEQISDFIICMVLIIVYFKVYVCGVCWVLENVQLQLVIEDVLLMVVSWWWVMNVELLCDVLDVLLWVQVGEICLWQIFGNLFINVFDVFVEKVLLWCLWVIVSQDQYGVILILCDNGLGFFEDVLVYVYEFFFIIKIIVKGFGFGLVICDNLLCVFGGCLEMGNYFEGGVVVCLYLLLGVFGVVVMFQEEICV